MAAIPIDDEGRFAGYASVFDRLDEAGDLVMPGAFAKSLARRGASKLRMLFQHDPREPIGTWETVREDAVGLWAEGRLVAGVPRADALRRLIERRAIDGLSIGFRTTRATREAASGHRRLWAIELWEISIVTFPMLAEARIASRSGLRPARDEAALRAAISLFKQ
ncbi:HK97 family phage prohead protease [Devosia sp.]|uniref:HK97 family phage prohead protease n=1 Tax=Devosia sp. TaxID=1871048 RepID=UPI0035B0B663